MKTPKNNFTHALAAQKKQIGIWVSMGSTYAAEAIAPAGYDWALIDMEHTLNDYFSVFGQLQAFAASNTSVIVRPDWNNPVMVKRLLDMGAQGLLFPMIQNVEEAKLAVASTRYPPRGIRGAAGMTRASKFGRIPDYVHTAEAELTVILQIETLEALKNAEDIAAVDGVSGIFFGPADIAADMGKLGKPNDPEVWAEIMPVAKRLIARGIPVGTIVLDDEFSANLLNEGFTFVACTMDVALVSRGSDSVLASVRGKMNI